MTVRPHGSSWMAYLLAGLLVIVAVAAMLAYPNRVNGPEAMRGLGVGIELPKAPSLPEGPKMPSPPIPTPK